MSVILITGAGGLIGSESVSYFCQKGHDVIGLDNDMRATFFGKEASVGPRLEALKKEFPDHFTHLPLDIRDEKGLAEVFKRFEHECDLIIHTAAQPSHDWAASDPKTDFSVNATATLGLLEAFRHHCPNALFIYTSTNKVYGNNPNKLPFIEDETRYTLPKNHPYFLGINEEMSVDHCTHSLFGVSKLAADQVVQEYGAYFHLKTAVLRGGCLTGPHHQSVKIHGFLSYLVKSLAHNIPYTIYGYKGKQVRDNIHSYDFITAIDELYQAKDGPLFKTPRVYNMGGGIYNNCSLLEAISLLEQKSKKRMKLSYEDRPRIGDHQWYISDLRKFQKDFPHWRQTYSLLDILEEIYAYESK